LANFTYFLATEKPADSPIRAYMTERAWQYLKQIADYFILPRLDRESTRQAPIEDVVEFSRYTFKVFLDLARTAFDKRDLETFRTVLHEMKQLFVSFDPQQNSNAAFLAILTQQATDQAERDRLTARLGQQRKFG
jgi:hypothetical protein